MVCVSTKVLWCVCVENSATVCVLWHNLDPADVPCPLAGWCTAGLHCPEMVWTFSCLNVVRFPVALCACQECMHLLCVHHHVTCYCTAGAPLHRSLKLTSTAHLPPCMV